ncbi:MAG: hypothetical protein JJU28_00610 [Cyclobacteriaceae bacterium]|nr:hypothetical protein [Cyclobacteriaceae bacterium]
MSCNVYQRVQTPVSENLIDLETDKEDKEHQLIILDPGFETWFITNWSPAQDRSYSYYKHWNDQYVQAWNFKAMQPRYAYFFENIIQYDPHENYGMEITRKLYYYFRWVEIELRIPILDIPRMRRPI